MKLRHRVELWRMRRRVRQIETFTDEAFTAAVKEELWQLRVALAFGMPLSALALPPAEYLAFAAKHQWPKRETR